MVKSSQCPLCHDRGLRLLETGAVPCQCVQERSRMRLRQKAGLTPGMEEFTFRNFSLDYYSKQLYHPDKHISYYQGARQAVQAAEAFVQEFLKDAHTSGLMFVGPIGSGKTFLAAAICNALIDVGVKVQFVVVPDLLDELRASYRRHYWASIRDENRSEDWENEPLIERVLKVPLLVLDDLGAHNYTDWTRNTIYSLLNYRMNYRLPVVITTNLGLNELDGFLGERTTSRIIYLCRSFRLMVEKDIRHIKSQEREGRYRR
ncbi:MAG: ATP-binding protein [Syntrophomonadaceae bacterium]|nr:ATP-binding protein [Syntrophomonadaceae bacterium]